MRNRWMANGSALLLAGCLSLMLAGCGGGASSTDTTSGSSSSTSSSTTTGSVGAYTIVDTGQTTFYGNTAALATAPAAASDPFYGQDAQFTGRQPSYRDNGDGTVTDLNTGLMWVKARGSKMSWADAVAGAATCSIGGYHDWRVPTVKELYSLIEFTGNLGTTDANSVPYIDTDVFGFAFGDTDPTIPNTTVGNRVIDGQDWTATKYVSTTMRGAETVFGVNFIDGRIKGYPVADAATGAPNLKYVRYVRGNPDYGVNNFVDNGDGTITDKATGLMWAQNDSGVGMDWQDALAWVQQKNAEQYLGHSDWRLPNAKELQSIVDYTRSPDTTGSAAIDPLFHATAITNEGGAPDYPWYWSGTTHVENNTSDEAVYLCFGRALGWMQFGSNSYDTLVDAHGAGAQRTDPKSGSDTDYPLGVDSNGNEVYGRGPQGDVVRIDNFVRLVRDSAANSTATAEYTLFAPLQSRTTYLIDADGNTVHSWQGDARPALSVYLLPDGELLRTEKVDTLPTTFASNVGGSGGKIEILDWDGNVVWSKTLATDSYLSNHDVAVLPNGNILAIVWEAKSAADVLAMGRTSVSGDTVWAGAVYEICRHSATNACTDGDIVWKWSSWDHVAQDVDPGITGTYVASIADHPDRINLNYVPSQSTTGFADWMHFNGIDYNAETDQILISVHNFNEYWIIDHDDSTKGIIARVGNPAAYDGTGPQTLFGQHDAHWIPAGLPGAGNILVFNNGLNRPEGAYSSVDEFCGTGNDCTPGDLVSSYSQGVSGDFYADHLGSAQRLENGDTLVCEGTDGRIFEYNSSHDIDWEYDYDGEIFRAVDYPAGYSGLANLK